MAASNPPRFITVGPLPVPGEAVDAEKSQEGKGEGGRGESAMRGWNNNQRLFVCDSRGSSVSIAFVGGWFC